MSHHYRCSSCRGRNVWPKALSEYVRGRRCRHCGHKRFYVDRERVSRLACYCGGYRHAHRPGSRRCEQNTMHPFWRSGQDLDVLAELMAAGKGRVCRSDRIPF